jgi:hypothetical protein
MLKRTCFDNNEKRYIPNVLKKSPFIVIVRAKIISLLILSIYISISIEYFFCKLKVYTVSEVGA